MGVATTRSAERTAAALGRITQAATVFERADDVPKHIEIKELPEEQRFAQLAPVGKQLVDTIKLMAYRAEPSLVILARQTLKRHDDARSFVRGLLTSTVNLRPDPARRELLVEIHGQANPIHDATLFDLCRELNEAEFTYPGTDLRFVFAP